MKRKIQLKPTDQPIEVEEKDNSWKWNIEVFLGLIFASSLVMWIVYRLSLWIIK